MGFQDYAAPTTNRQQIEPGSVSVLSFSNAVRRKEGEFVGGAAGLRIQGHYDEMRAHALEEDLVSTHPPMCTKDETPWQTYLNGTPWAKGTRQPAPE